MKKLVIDIETVGHPWDELDPYVREYMVRGLSEDEAEEARRAGALSPFRGKIITIGVLNISDGRSAALYERPGQTELEVERVGLRTYISGSEKMILEKFWEFFDSDSRFISFNGRQFDGPFLMIRSAINGIIPKRDLVGYRYGFHPNCDLREALNFFGTAGSRQFRFNLDLACKAFGVETSKGEGIDGRSVETWYRAGRYRQIADYCLEDVRATAELYEKIAQSLLMFNNEFRISEERERRALVEAEAQLSMIPAPAEPSFIDSVTETSLALASSLEEEEPRPPASTGKHQAVVLEKFVRDTREEEFPGE